MRSALRLAVAAALLASGGEALAAIRAELVSGDFQAPVFATAPAGDTRLFVVERGGTIRIADTANGAIRPEPFLDLNPDGAPPKVSTRGEGGLLGLAFDPGYASNGLLYVYYTAPGVVGESALVSTLSRFRVSDDPDVADPTEDVLLRVAQPFANHDGGTLAFGRDARLYFGLGDGGSQFDPQNRAQNPLELFGKLLRLDVSGGFGTPYAIPQDNPFVDVGGSLDEIWALGLRNPYRFSFDGETGDLWIGDVGQNALEEIDFEPADSPGGLNYGWDVMEGTSCNRTDPTPAPPCNDPPLPPPAGLTLPIHEYPHPSPCGSVTGGHVYRGVLPEIQGLYFFGDYCSGQIFSFDPASGQATERSAELSDAVARFQLVGFGEDSFGELYLVHLNGNLYRLRSTLPDADDDGVPDPADNCIEVANGPIVRDAGGTSQLDADADGYGNLCDADLNNDGAVDFLDLGALKSRFFSEDPVADLNGDGHVDFLDLGRMKAAFFAPPGPSALAP